MKKLIIFISLLFIFNAKAYDMSEYYNNIANERVKSYNEYGIRVHNDKEVMNAIDDIVNNFKIGEYHLVFSENDSINVNNIHNYIKGKYAVVNNKQNYYNYKLKGNIDPLRFYTFLDDLSNNEILFDTRDLIRLTKEEYNKTNYFVDKLIPYLKGDGSDYDKIKNSFTYIKDTTPYITDNGFINNLAADNTSIYDVFINRRSVCIGYSVAFSFLMDKFGIESYIIDNITVNETDKSYYSTHSYNVIKLDNKFYKVDITSGEFLVPLGSNILYDNKLTLATTKYSINKYTSIDFNAINNILNEVNKMNFKDANYSNNNSNTTTTTTTKINNNKTNKNNNNPTESVTVEESTTETTTNIYNVEENKLESSSIAKKENKENKLNLNLILVPVLIFSLILLLIYELKFKSRG